MARRKEFQTEVVDVEITSMNAKALGIGRYTHDNHEPGENRNLKLTIPNTLPGDTVRVSVPNARGRKRAQLNYDSIIEPSPERVTPPCIHFEYCGGCSLQQLSYQNQLKWKTSEVKRFLEENNHDSSVVKDAIGMDVPWHYRNKMEFTFGSDGTLGMHEQGNFRVVRDIHDCLIATKDTVAIRSKVSLWQHEFGIPGYNKEKHEGVLRHLMVRHSKVTDEIMVAIFATASYENIAGIGHLVQTLTHEFKNIKSILWMKNEDIADRSASQDTVVLFGREFINDEMYGFKYRLYFDTFFQPNPVQANRMVELAMEFSEVDKDMRVLDLFCGVGTFSLPFAEKAKELAGIEIVESSIESARRNATDNNIYNTYFITSDARKGMDQLKEEWGTPDLLLLDPPRSGAGGKVMRRVGRLGTEKIVYVSCNPETFAMDITHLEEFGYCLKNVQPVDQFPHTPHVELVSLLEKTGETELF